jgi:hypothetical protein
MSKKFKNKTCVYCANANASQEPDHVFARGFFLISKRDNLPKVPACGRCNGEKSKLEHYLTAALPCGGWNPDSKVIMETKIASRLDKNRKLYNQFMQGIKQVWIQEENNIILPGGTLPIEFVKLQRLFCFIIKGLLWYHWKTILAPANDYLVDATILKHNGEAIQHLWTNMLTHLPHRSIKQNYGDDTFEYEGIQLIDCPQISLWKFFIYGGLTLGSDSHVPFKNPFLNASDMRYSTTIWGISVKAGPGLQLHKIP